MQARFKRVNRHVGAGKWTTYRNISCLVKKVTSLKRERERETDIIIRLDMRYRRLPETVTVAHETRDAEFMYELIRGAILVALVAFSLDHRLQPPRRQITADKTTSAADLRRGLRQGKSDDL